MKGRNQFLICIIMLALLSYVASASEKCPSGVDSDNDGYGIGCALGEDCNDNDPYVNPGAEEFCGNGIDDNCNGQIDELPCTNCIDHDKDGYGQQGSSGCAHTEIDCNDNDLFINQGVQESTLELCTDGTDNNCNGLIDKDDQACSSFYPVVVKEEAPKQQEAITTGCVISSQAWATSTGELVTQAGPGEELMMIAYGENCKGEEITFSIQKKDENTSIQSELKAKFGEQTDSEGNPLDNQAIYTTQAPAEEGEYTFTATSVLQSVTSDPLQVKTAAELACEVQWDCSSIEYGACTNGIKKRQVCPGYEGTPQCCTDEASCACTALYPEGACESYTYAKPEEQKTCAGAAEEKPAAPAQPKEAAEAKPGLPWLLIAGAAVLLVIAAAVILLLARRKPVEVPASLLNYVKAARDKKVPDQAIRDALLKSGWKPEQVNSAFKKAK